MLLRICFQKGFAFILRYSVSSIPGNKTSSEKEFFFKISFVIICCCFGYHEDIWWRILVNIYITRRFAAACERKKGLFYSNSQVSCTLLVRNFYKTLFHFPCKKSLLISKQTFCWISYSVALQLRPDTRFFDSVQFLALKHVWLKNYSTSRSLPRSHAQNHVQ